MRYVLFRHVPLALRVVCWLHEGSLLRAAPLAVGRLPRSPYNLGSGASCLARWVAPLWLWIGLFEVMMIFLGFFLVTSRGKTRPCSAHMCGIRLSESPQVFLNPNQSFGLVAR